MTRSVGIVAGLACVLLVAPAGKTLAQNGPGDRGAGDAGRYQIVDTDKGFLRLDTLSGSVSICAELNGGLVCRLAADDRAVFETELRRLEQENALLSERVAALEEQLSASDGNAEEAAPEPDASGEGGGVASEEIDKVVDFSEKVMRRFFDMVEDMRDELEGGSDSGKPSSPENAPSTGDQNGG